MRLLSWFWWWTGGYWRWREEQSVLAWMAGFDAGMAGADSDGSVAIPPHVDEQFAGSFIRGVMHGEAERTRKMLAEAAGGLNAG